MACASNLAPTQIALQTTLTERGRPLAALSHTGLELLFHSWRGASGRRYVCSVYDVEQPPAFDCSRAVVIAVRRDAAGAASIAFVFQPDPLADSLSLWQLRARQCGAAEWHVHLLAASASERAFAARDLAESVRWAVASAGKTVAASAAPIAHLAA